MPLAVTQSIAPADLDTLLTPEEFAKWVQETPRWAMDQARAKKIPAVKLGKQWRFHPRTVLEKCATKNFAMN